MKQNSKATYPLLIFALVLLFNPNINIVDVLPDFIAWFILAALFEYASDCAAYFEEARQGFVKLGFISVLRIPAFFLVNYIRRQNTLDNDVLALASFTFAVCELIFLIPAINNLFRALSHVGERTLAARSDDGSAQCNTAALISPFPLPIIKSVKITPDTLRIVTVIFAVSKAAFAFIPDLLLLTKTTSIGGATQVLAISRYYPYVLVALLLLGLIIGALWLSIAIKYASTVHREGNLHKALSLLASEGTEAAFEKKRTLRKTSRTLTLFAVASLFCVDLTFDNFQNINLLPQFIYGVFLFFAILSLRKLGGGKAITLIISLAYIIASSVSYGFSVSFLSRYQYLDLMTDKAALRAYIPVEISSAAEALLLVLLLLFITLEINAFIKRSTGVSPDSDRYRITEKRYHTSLIARSWTLFGIGALMGITKFIGVFLNSDVQILYAFVDDFDQRPIAASALPWFGVIVLAAAIIYIAYSFYFFGVLKEEVKLKSSTEQ